MLICLSFRLRNPIFAGVSDDTIDGLDEIIGEFLVESHENLDQLDQDLVALERDPSSTALLASVFRTIHTIKGTSGFLAFNILESVTHVGESLLARLRDGEMALNPRRTTLLLEVVDAVRELLSQIEADGTEGTLSYPDLVDRLTHELEHGDATEEDEPAEVTEQDHEAEPAEAASPAPTIAPASAIPASAIPASVIPASAPTPSPVAAESEVEPPAPGDHRRSVADSTIRVDVALLDSLMNLVGELVLTRNQLLQRSAHIGDTELARTTHRLNLIAGELQEGVMKTRMQQIDTVWNKLPRVVRDLSVQLGKSVELVMEGQETELDKTILEAVRDPLTHLVRNSIDHGIETTEDRRAAGKSDKGTLTLRAYHESGQVTIEIADDGAGINPERLRAKAVEKGLLTREAAGLLSDHEATQLVFMAGFSTAAAITNVSGRGVGMDVVKTNVEAIGGTIDLLSEPGQGTTVRVRIPLTLAIIPALLVSTDNHRYAIPQVNLLELVRLDAEQSAVAIEHVHGAPVYRLRGRLLPLVDLREQLELAPSDSATTYIVVLQSDEERYGLIVDDILDTEEIVVKPLSQQLRGIGLFAGATIMGDGSVALILDATAVARRAGMSAEASRTTSRDAGEVAAADTTSLLVVELGDGRRAALPLASVDRLEQVTRSSLEQAGNHDVVQYRGSILPLLHLDHALMSTGASHSDVLDVIVCHAGEHLIGVVVAQIVDIVASDLAVRSSLDSGGDHGSAVIHGHVTELVDVDNVAASITAALTREFGGTVR